MSFMFNPYPYSDPNARNRLDPTNLSLDRIQRGGGAVGAALLEGRRADLPCVIAVDGCATAPFSTVETLIEQHCHLFSLPVITVHMEDLFLPSGQIDQLLRETCLPEDRKKDPVLLYGSLFEGGYEALWDRRRLADLEKKLRAFRETGQGILLLSGAGSLSGPLRKYCDTSVFLDVTPVQAMLNLKSGGYRNLGSETALPFKQMARRCYYVDFELAQAVREQVIAQGLDWYILASNPADLTIAPFEVILSIFARALEYPLRCKPVYLEGVWGGYYIQRLRDLPAEMTNCAWVFDFIPMEVSIVFDLNDMSLEFPFYTLVQSQAERLMGPESVSRFGKYFPLRFNYDDTWHSNGNMSIQCHPGEEYITAENNELGRQDESYYIVEAAQGAKTYLGFRQGVTAAEFVREAKRSEQDGTPMDYARYVHAVDSAPGTQLMIPAGTIHASGRNQLILEIGSLTVGSYTYKMYDYLRADLDGNPRPIHTLHGEQVLVEGRGAEWVQENLVQRGYPVEQGEDWEEFVVGEHDLLYFSLRNIRFQTMVRQHTQGRFHVLTLVDGEQVMIRSLRDPSRRFLQNYLDIVVVPADFGAYEIVNMREGTTAIIHKTLLK